MSAVGGTDVRRVFADLSLRMRSLAVEPER
jgi:hypothetical protein